MATITQPVRHIARRTESAPSSITTQLAWFAGGLALAFSIPYIFTSLFELHHDVYYGLYFAMSLAFLYAYVRATGFDVRGLFTRNWRWSLGVGAASTAFVVFNVLTRDSTDGPSGLYAAFEVLWRGLAYGTVDALLLTAFPGAVAMTLVAGRLDGIAHKLRFAAIAAALVLSITAVYHLGYQQFREDGIGAPEIGNNVISLPLYLTGNPLGSVMAHASMHTTADLHAYETDVFLPPQTDAP